MKVGVQMDTYFILKIFTEHLLMNKISPLAFVDPEAKLGDNCEIGPFASSTRTLKSAVETA